MHVSCPPDVIKEKVHCHHDIQTLLPVCHFVNRLLSTFQCKMYIFVLHLMLPSKTFKRLDFSLQLHAGFCKCFGAKLNCVCWPALPQQACVVGQWPRILLPAPPLPWVRGPTTAVRCRTGQEPLPASLVLSALQARLCPLLISPEMLLPLSQGKAGLWRENVCVWWSCGL